MNDSNDSTGGMEQIDQILEPYNKLQHLFCLMTYISEDMPQTK